MKDEVTSVTRMVTAPPADGREFRAEELHADLVVVGGGMSGTCCAITAARAGARVVLVQDRPVLGGNASSEVRLWIIGGNAHGDINNRWAREGGVLDEILVENLYRNRGGNAVIFDTVVLDKVVQEPNITLLLNTALIGADKDADSIASVRAFCGMNQTMYTVHAPLFCDASGDGALGYLAGAAFRMGAESRDEFDEPFAPSEEWGTLLGHSLFFYSKDAGHPVEFLPPSYALDDVTTIPEYRSFNTTDHGTRLWWLEYGGRLHTIHDTEQIKWELWKIVYGIWNHLKNSGEHPEAENLTLEWVGLIPGRRESRRFEGHYMLRQQDIVDQTEHPDGVAFGGWGIDLHPADGIFSEHIYHPEQFILWSRGTYQIPYRCLVSRNISNLFLAGRVISASHVAFGSTRVIGTGSHMGQAVGMAAAKCVREGLRPADLLAPERMVELRRELLRTGQHVPGVRLDDPDDLVRDASLSASSELVLRELPADGPPIALDRSRAQLLPLPSGPMPKLRFALDVAAASTLRVEARTGHRPYNYTPDVVLAMREIDLDVGAAQEVEIEFDVEIDEPRYVFVCLMRNEHVAARTSSHRATGLLSVAHASTQEADAVGRRRIELWNPESQGAGRFPNRTSGLPACWNFAVTLDPPVRPFGADNVRNGYARPTSQPNAWVADPDDPSPSLALRWAQPQQIRRLDLSFDTNFDHPMESVLLDHQETAMAFCVRHYRVRAGDRVVAEVLDNHQTRNCHEFDPPLKTDRLTLEVVASNGDVPVAMFDVRCYG